MIVDLLYARLPEKCLGRLSDLEENFHSGHPNFGKEAF
jgi:hypothetical protein